MDISLRKPNIQRKARIIPAIQTPFSQLHESPFSNLNNNIYEERPLNNNSKNLSFKGLSISEPTVMKVADVIKAFGEDFGQTAVKGFEEKLYRADSLKGVDLKIKDGVINFKERPLLRRLGDLLVYPFKDMPIDLVNSVVKGLEKIPGIKDSKFIKDFGNIKPLRNRRNHLEATSDAIGIKHYVEMATGKERGKIFTESQKRFNPLISNYDSTVEKTITRVVTGMIPAFYLANDAYNLSMYVNNNKDVAKKEKKRRFNQEVSRIAITAGSTYGVLKLFSKSSNASSKTTVILMGGITLVSEFVGRLMVGTPIFPISKKEAKKYAEMHAKTNPRNLIPSKDMNFSANVDSAKKSK